MRDVRRVVGLLGLRWTRLSIALLLGTVATVAGIALVALSGYLICRAAQQPPILSLTVVIVAVRAVALVRPTARYGERLAAHDLAFRCLGRVRVAVYSRIEPLAPAGLDRVRDGDVLTRIVADVDELQDVVLRVALPVGVSTLSCSIVVLGVATVSVPCAAILGIGLAVTGVATGAAAHRTTARARVHRGALRAQLTADLLQSLEAAEELWLNEADGQARRSLDATDAALVATSTRDAAGAGIAGAIAVLGAGLTVIGVVVTATASAADGAVDALVIAPLVLAAVAAFDAVVPVATAARHVPSTMAAGRRVLALVDTPPEVVDPPDPAAITSVRPPVSLDDVVIERGRGADRVTIVAGVDLDLAPGDRLVVTGPSGAGKSTVLQLLVRFVERSGGSATIDGHDLCAVAQDDVRRHVLLLDQDAHVFNSNLRENVAFARPGATDDDIRGALARAQLLDLVDGLPDGLDTFVGDGGRRLSGGERRRVAVARAFLRDPGVVLLDEPTAHLDTETAQALLDDLWHGLGTRSVVLVSHGACGPFDDVPQLVLPARAVPAAALGVVS